MKKLYQARIGVRVSECMDESRTDNHLRLVWADSPEDAEKTIKAEYEYDTLYTVWDITLTEALGSPL